MKYWYALPIPKTVHTLSWRLTNIAVSEYRSLYQPTVPDRLDARWHGEDGRQQGQGGCLAERAQREVGL